MNPIHETKVEQGGGTTGGGPDYVVFVCPSCGHRRFVWANGYTRVVERGDPLALHTGGTVIVASEVGDAE